MMDCKDSCRARRHRQETNGFTLSLASCSFASHDAKDGDDDDEEDCEDDEEEEDDDEEEEEEGDDDDEELLAVHQQ